MKKSLFIFLLAAAIPAAAQDLKTLNLVDPEYREAAKDWVVDFSNPETRRQTDLRNESRAAESSQPAETWTVPAARKQPAVSLYVYKPKNASGKLPVIYFIHGGGYILGNAKMGGDSLQAMADRQNAAVVSVEYRLATKSPFPADLNDAYRGLEYVYKNAAKHGLDSERVVLMGESAGGGLTARLALYTRDQGKLTPEGQVLVYPMLDYRTGTPDSPYLNENASEFVWTAAANRTGWNSLRGGQTIRPEQMPYFSPALAPDLSRLPPVFMITGDLDLFANEDADYANRLMQAGVPTELHILPGIYHAFENANPEGAATRNYLQWRTDAIKRMFANPIR